MVLNFSYRYNSYHFKF